MPLACHVGARRVRASADVRVEWPERRGSVACREMWERRGRGLGAGAAAVAGVPGADMACCRWRAVWGLGGCV